MIVAGVLRRIKIAVVPVGKAAVVWVLRGAGHRVEKKAHRAVFYNRRLDKLRLLERQRGGAPQSQPRRKRARAVKRHQHRALAAGIGRFALKHRPSAARKKSRRHRVVARRDLYSDAPVPRKQRVRVDGERGLVRRHVLTALVSELPLRKVVLAAPLLQKIRLHRRTRAESPADAERALIAHRREKTVIAHIVAAWEKARLHALARSASRRSSLAALRKLLRRTLYKLRKIRAVEIRKVCRRRRNVAQRARLPVRRKRARPRRAGITVTRPPPLPFDELGIRPGKNRTLRRARRTYKDSHKNKNSQTFHGQTTSIHNSPIIIAKPRGPARQAQKSAAP